MTNSPQGDDRTGNTQASGDLDPDLDSTLDRHTDLDELRNGGPTETPGAMTTTGGSAGPASVRRRVQPGAGPTTTGAAGSGGMHAPIGGGTSDATTTGSGAAAVSRPDDETETRRK
jgi:hypothetical protein